MIKKLLFLTCIFSCVSLITVAQNSARQYIGIYSGYSNHIIKDDIISPLKYEGSKAPIGLMYSVQKSKSMQNLTVYYDKAILESSISNSRSSPYTNNINAKFGYTYNRKIYSISPINADLYVGGKFLWEISYREHFYDNYYNEITGEQITSIGLNLIFLKKFINSDDNILVALSIPVLGYSLFNNRYNTAVGEATENLDEARNRYWQLIKNGQLNTPNNFQEFQSTISYRKYVSKNIGFLFMYQLHFYNLSQYKDTFYARHLNNQLNIGFVIKI